MAQKRQHQRRKCHKKAPEFSLLDIFEDEKNWWWKEKAQMAEKEEWMKGQNDDYIIGLVGTGGIGGGMSGTRPKGKAAKWTNKSDQWMMSSSKIGKQGLGLGPFPSTTGNGKKWNSWKNF
jgi:hypothetical protein